MGDRSTFVAIFGSFSLSTLDSGCPFCTCACAAEAQLEDSHGVPLHSGVAILGPHLKVFTACSVPKSPEHPEKAGLKSTSVPSLPSWCFPNFGESATLKAMVSPFKI